MHTCNQQQWRTQQQTTSTNHINNQASSKRWEGVEAFFDSSKVVYLNHIPKISKLFTQFHNHYPQIPKLFKIRGIQSTLFITNLKFFLLKWVYIRGPS